jgi:acetyltransferase-like isoleucine patch superfamily enzyme
MRGLLLWILRVLGGEGFAHPDFSPLLLARCFVNQKILRVNGKVPWAVHPTSVVTHPERIVRGTRLPGMSPGCYIQGNNRIILGRNVWIGPGVGLISANHDPQRLWSHQESEPLRIGDNCWIGMHAVILPGVRLADHVVVGAGAVVTRSFGPNCLIAGNPARVIRELPPHEEAAPVPPPRGEDLV